MPGMATNPKYEGQVCRGLRLRVTRPELFRAVDFGIHLIATVHELHPDKLVIRESGMRLMTGSTAVTAALIEGQAPETVIASWEKELKEFLSLRQKYLLYD